jgi:hypothetical protein
MKSVALSDLIIALRTAKELSSRYYADVDGYYRSCDEAPIERELEKHGYLKVNGKLYQSSDFKLLSPLEI